MSVEETVKGCERILDGEFSEHGEGALYMIGAVDEARKGRNEKRRREEQGDKADNEGETAEEERHA